MLEQITPELPPEHSRTRLRRNKTCPATVFLALQTSQGSHHDACNGGAVGMALGLTEEPLSGEKSFGKNVQIENLTWTILKI